MASGRTSRPTGVVVRKLAFTGVGVFCFAVGLTLLFLGMRAVMDVGGYCASGGPYEIRQECPDGAWLMVVGIFVGLAGTGLTVAGTFAGGPQLWVLAWPALFCSLGWNFLEYAVDPPPPEQGLVWGWLVCAIVFLAMGGIPLLFVVAGIRSVLWGNDDGPVGAPRTVSARLGRSSNARIGAVVMAPTSGAPPAPPTVGSDDRGGDEPADDVGRLVRDLERLAALHRSGALSNDEFARAKAARLAEEET